MNGIQVQTTQGQVHIFYQGRSVTWQAIGMQALCTVCSRLEGEGDQLGSFINPISVTPIPTPR